MQRPTEGEQFALGNILEDFSSLYRDVLRQKVNLVGRFEVFVDFAEGLESKKFLFKMSQVVFH